MNGFPEKALVLAAGLGTRLRPLTLARPKPLLPLWGVPLLGRVLEMLEAWGVREVAVNLHWRPEMIREYLAERASGTRVRFSHEPEILGTGGALRPVRSFLEGGPFWVVNSDIAAALDPENEEYVEMEVRGKTIYFKMEAKSAGSLRNAADDLLACLKIAEEASGLIRISASDPDGDPSTE